MSAAAYATPTPAPVAAPIAATPAPVVAPSAPAAEASKDASLLDDLFDEFKQEMGETSDHSDEDPDTHYNLGVAFKEMGLLDEAIGELQKVCQAIDRGLPFPQTMQAYTWLAHCFVEKGVPEASFMWFDRALSVASDNDTRAAILYELGSAYEMASQREKAREAFTKVMSINIDFRDVGERIKALKS
jgi:tetratricopeptide (TPR) repeat protein